MSNRALYGEYHYKGLYSPSSGRMLYGIKKKDMDDDIENNPQIFRVYHVTTNFKACVSRFEYVADGRDAVRSDVYPAMLHNLNFSWDINGTTANSSWMRKKTYARGHGAIAAKLYMFYGSPNTTYTAMYVKIRTNPLYTFKDAGSGGVYFGVTLLPNVGTSLAASIYAPTTWGGMRGQKLVGVSGGGERSYTIPLLHQFTSNNIGNYALMLTLFINNLAPPTLPRTEYTDRPASSLGLYSPELYMKAGSL